MARLIILMCLLGAGMGGYFLYSDLISTDGSGKGKPMATVERRESKVRRKPSGSYIWSNVEQSQFLYRKDSVQTGSASTASIRLSDQSVLELGEDSLVVIDDIKNLSLNFLRGSMVIRGEKGDRQLSRATDGQLKIEELPLRLLKPEPQAIYFSTEGTKKEVSFSWGLKKVNLISKDPQIPEGASLQISTERNFIPSKTQTTKIFIQSEQKTQLELLSGKYFWRIFSEGKPLTEVRAFRVANAFILKPLWPISITEKIRTWKEESVVQFRWTNEKASESLGTSVEHRLEISSDPDFKNMIKSESIDSQSSQAMVKGLQEGDLFWRIKSRFGELVLSSKTENFGIEKNQKLRVDPVFPFASSSLENRKELRFVWKGPMVAGLEYQFELQKDKKSQIIERLPGTIYSWKKCAPGSYRWRVLAYHQKDSAGETPWQELTLFQGRPIQLSFPKNSQGIHYWEKPSDFSFEWEKDENFNGKNFYQIEVATDSEFKSKVDSKMVTENILARARLKLEPGAYYWRVGIVDPGGSMLKVSQSAHFTWGPFPLLSPPTQALPMPGTIFDIIRDAKDPVLSWEKVKDAAAYEVSVNRNSAGKETVVLKKVTDQSFFQVSGLPEGQYFWTVRPIDPLKRLGSALPRRKFDISYGKPLEAPQVLSAEVQ